MAPNIVVLSSRRTGPQVTDYCSEILLHSRQLNHTDVWVSNPAVQGWYIANVYSIPAVVVNTSTSAESVAGTSLDPSQILMHPGGLDWFGGNPPFYNAVLRFTASNAGNYAVNGDWESLAAGSVINYVLKTSGTSTTTLFSSSDDNSVFGLTDITLAVGDTIDFVVNPNGDIGADSTGLRATVTAIAVPEPASLTLSLLCLGGLGLAGIAKRRRTRKAAEKDDVGPSGIAVV